MKQNKKEWFSGQIREYQDVMYGYAFCMLRNDSDAKDVMQDAIIKAFQKLEQLKNPDRFKPWIMSILRNCIYDLMRDRKEYDVLDHEWVMPDNNSISIEEKVDLYQAVQKLDFSYRTVTALNKLPSIDSFSIASAMWAFVFGNTRRVITAAVAVNVPIIRFFR